MNLIEKSEKIYKRFNCLISESGYDNILKESITVANNETQQEKIQESIPSNYLDTSQFTFRKTLWGMSMAEVINNEGSQGVISDNIIMYTNKSIGGKECTIGYVFSDGKLCRAKYIFKETHTYIIYL